MRRLNWFGVLLGGLGVAVVAFRAPAGAREVAGVPVAPLAVSRERVQGQWIWTARDREIFERTRREHPALSVAVFVGTIECESGALRTRRGLSPLSAGNEPRALVVRLSDSVHACVERQSEAEFARGLDARLAALLSEVKASGARFEELQLDYDAPVSKLPRWASALRYLNAHALSGIDVWITSLPVHVEQPNYGALMRGVVTGHIVQVFDTGLSCDAENAEHLRAALQAQLMPYRVGYGTFERNGVPADHAHQCWLGLTQSWRNDPGASGFWVFPAGIPYGPSLAQLMAAP
jgi:Protein of unknown function (DUF3142)